MGIARDGLLSISDRAFFKTNYMNEKLACYKKLVQLSTMMQEQKKKFDEGIQQMEPIANEFNLTVCQDSGRLIEN